MFPARAGSDKASLGTDVRCRTTRIAGTPDAVATDFDPGSTIPASRSLLPDDGRRLLAGADLPPSCPPCPRPGALIEKRVGQSHLRT